MTTYHNIHTHGKEEFASAGIHPWHIGDAEEQLRQLREAVQRPEVVFIGEAGLDKLADAPMPIQQEVFTAQARMAEEVRKPLIIHCVKAWQELLAIRKGIKPSVPWIIHGFRGNANLARQLTNQGLYLSFGEHFNPEAPKAAWPGHLFAETDDSDVDIRMVYQKIAEALQVTVEELALQIGENVGRVICID